jgi:hypothetical protein
MLLQSYLFAAEDSAILLVQTLRCCNHVLKTGPQKLNGESIENTKSSVVQVGPVVLWNICEITGKRVLAYSEIYTL